MRGLYAMVMFVCLCSFILSVCRPWNLWNLLSRHSRTWWGARAYRIDSNNLYLLFLRCMYNLMLQRDPGTSVTVHRYGRVGLVAASFMMGLWKRDYCFRSSSSSNPCVLVDHYASGQLCAYHALTLFVAQCVGVAAGYQVSVRLLKAAWYLHKPGSRHCHLAIGHCTLRQRVFDCKYLSRKICLNVLNYYLFFNLYCLVNI